MNTNIGLKFVLDEEVRKVKQQPTTMNGLNKVLQRLYSHADFRCQYLDEENDLITIRTDTELVDAYAVASDAGLTCLRIQLTANSRPKIQAQEEEIAHEAPTCEHQGRRQRNCGGRGQRGRRMGRMQEMLRSVIREELDNSD